MSTSIRIWSACAGVACVVGATASASGRSSSRALSIAPFHHRLATGEVTTCALNNASELYCWGSNKYFGEYGASVEEIPSSPTPIRAGVSKINWLTPGPSSHMCGLSATRVAWCWGRNTNGQLGSGVMGPNSVQASPGVGAWADLSTGRISTCGVTTDSVAYCWGSNQRGEIGNAARGVKENASAPIEVDGGHKFVHIAAGWMHACGVVATGETFCWGDNSSGQLGIGAADTVAYRSPVQVKTSARFVQLSAGGRNTCGVTADHIAYCWGENVMAQLGDGTRTNRGVPTPVLGGMKFTMIATSSGFSGGGFFPIPINVQAGASTTCALAESGAAYCWGWNGYGQVGRGNIISTTVPVAVAGGHTFDEIAVGGAHACGMQKNTVWCWGGNATGQLGEGTFVNQSVPVLVEAPFNK